jgi:hypothetical protein
MYPLKTSALMLARVVGAAVLALPMSFCGNKVV